MKCKGFMSGILTLAIICAAANAPIVSFADETDHSVTLLDTASIWYDGEVKSSFHNSGTADEYETFRRNKPVNGTSNNNGGYALSQFQLSQEQLEKEIYSAEFKAYVTAVPKVGYKVAESIFTADSLSSYTALVEKWIENAGYTIVSAEETGEAVTVGGETYKEITVDVSEALETMQSGGKADLTIGFTGSDSAAKMLSYGSTYAPSLTLVYSDEVEIVPEKENAVYSIVTAAQSHNPTVDISKISNSPNITGYQVTVAKNKEQLSKTIIERGDNPNGLDAIDVTASEGDDIEIAPIYEYKKTRAYGNGITLEDKFPDGRYDITVTNGGTNHTDLYVNGYMVANNIDETGGDGRSVSTGSTYTAHDVKVEGGAIKIETKDSANSLSYVKAVKAPSIVESKKKIFITGDSLVCNYYGGNTENYLGTTQTGWGQALLSFIDTDKYEIVNLANSGYWAERLRTTAFPGIIYNAVEGDIFLLESGVNDYWNPSSSGRTENLPENRATMEAAVTTMVREAKAANLTVILVTPNAQPSRHDITNCFSEVMKEVAETESVQCIDLAALSHTLVYELYGSNGEDEETVTANMKANLGVNKDGTHSSYLGAMKYASIVGTELYKLGYEDMFTDYIYTKNDKLGNEIICKIDKTSAPVVDPTAEPLPTATAPPTVAPTITPTGEKCTKITAEYDTNGVMTNITTEIIDAAYIEPVQNTPLKKVFYWNSLSGMKPVTAPTSEPAASSAPAATDKPVQTEEPVQTEKPVQTENPVDEKFDYTFIFGGEEQGALSVNADTVYGEHNGKTYGLYGIDGAPDASDGRIDGFKSTEADPVTILKSGMANDKPYLTPDYSQYDETTIANLAAGVMPVRFSVAEEQHKYYTVSATVVNTSDTEDAVVTLYSEKRHAILAGYTLKPDESVTKTWNVNLESVYYNAGGIVDDTQLNICVAGRNAGLSRVSYKKHDTVGKTIWLCTDSTGCDQPSEIPYFPLRNYSGTGSLLAKYINPEIAVSNQGEGGLTAADNNHFNNAVKYMKSGDYLYVQYGLNDGDNNATDAAKFKANLEKYYTAANNAGAKLIIITPSERQSSVSWDDTNKKWKSSNGHFVTAAKAFVDEKIEAGADDIAFIDLNTEILTWMDKATQDIFEIRKEKFGDTEINKRAMEYYYLVSRSEGVDSIHINDFGTDNAAYLVMREAKKKVEVGMAEGASDNEKVQAAVLSELVENMNSDLPQTVKKEIIEDGWPANSYYPYPSSKEVNYEFPTIVKSASVEDGKLKSMTVKVQGSAAQYAQGCADILNADGTVKETVYTVSTDVNANISHIDMTSAAYGDVVVMNFADDVTIPSGGSYRVYLKGKENGAALPGDTYYSSVYTEPAAVKDYLITAPNTNTSEMFNYTIGSAVDENGVSGNKWGFVGSTGTKVREVAQKDGITAAHLVSNGSGSYNLCKFFNDFKQISSGKIKLHMQINPTFGTYTIKLHNTGRTSSWMDGIEIIRIVDGEARIYDQKSKNGKLAADIPVSGLKIGKWTDLDATLDIDRGIAELSVAGGTPVSCEIPALQTSLKSDVEKILPIKGITVEHVATGGMSASYSFETYITDLLVTAVETETPQIAVTAASENSTLGTVTGGGKVDINSDVTLTAAPLGDSAFAGWYKGSELYSMDNPLTIEKIRSDMSLTARFTEQKSKDQTASFEITANKGAVRRDSTLQLGVANAKDTNNIDVKDLTASDITWTTTEKGVNISSTGAVSFDNTFEIGDNTAKDVTVTGKFNAVTENYTIKVYSYAYYEEMKEGVTNYTGSFQTIASKEGIIFPTAAGIAVYTLTDSVELDKATTITYSSARNQASQNKSFKTLSFRNEDDEEVFALYYQYEGVGLDKSDLIWGALPSSGWADIKIDITPSADKLSITLTAENTKNGTVETKTKEVSTSVLSNTSITSVKLISDSGVTSGRDIGVGSIKIERMNILQTGT